MLIRNPLIQPIIAPVMPTLPLLLRGNMNVAKYLLTATLVIGFSLLLAYALIRIMRSKEFVSPYGWLMLLTGVVSLALFIRYGLSLTLLQGLFLYFTLLYASMSDITHHAVDDHIWVTILALALVSAPTVGILSMTVGGLFVIIPQMLMSFIPPGKSLGGADIKIATSLAVLLGLLRGVGAFFVGLLLAVIVMSIYNRVTQRSNGRHKPFPLVPFLSVGAMIFFMV